MPDQPYTITLTLTVSRQEDGSYVVDGGPTAAMAIGEGDTRYEAVSDFFIDIGLAMKGWGELPRSKVTQQRFQRLLAWSEGR